MVFRFSIFLALFVSGLFGKTIAIIPDSPGIYISDEESDSEPSISGELSSVTPGVLTSDGYRLKGIIYNQNGESLINHPLGRVIYDLRDTDIKFISKQYFGGLFGRHFESIRKADKVVFFNIYQSLPAWFCQVPKHKRYLIAFEPPSVYPWMYSSKCQELFHKILTFDDDLINIKPYAKYYYPVLKPMISNIPAFSKKKLLCIFAGNKSSKHPNELYSERKKAITFFDQNYSEEFDLYGPTWESENFTTYRGTVPIKEDVMKHYKFSICYENIENISGYITEKIFECFQAGCVPIYLGASNILDYIPKTCFIDKNEFASYEELADHLTHLDESTYHEYLIQIEKFLRSKKAKLYSVENFSRIFQQEIVFD